MYQYEAVWTSTPDLDWQMPINESTLQDVWQILGGKYTKSSQVNPGRLQISTIQRLTFQLHVGITYHLTKLINTT